MKKKLFSQKELKHLFYSFCLLFLGANLGWAQSVVSPYDTTTGLWTCPAGVTASGNATLVSTGVYTSTLPSITVNFKGVTTPAITSLPINAYAVNGVGTSATRLLNLTRALPKVVSSVKGSALVCNRTTGFNYTILASDGATKYLITGPTNSVVSSASNTTNTSNTLTTSDLSFNVVYTGTVTVSTKQTLTIKSMNGAGTVAAKSIALQNN